MKFRENTKTIVSQTFLSLNSTFFLSCGYSLFGNPIVRELP